MARMVEHNHHGGNAAQVLDAFKQLMLPWHNVFHANNLPLHPRDDKSYHLNQLIAVRKSVQVPIPCFSMEIVE